MGVLLGLVGVPNKLMLWGLIAVGLTALALGVRASIVSNAIARMEAKRDKQRVVAMLEKKRVKENAEELTDDELLAGIVK